MAGCPRSFGTTVSLAPEIVPELSQAVYAHIPGLVVLTFDIPMLEIPITGTNMYCQSLSRELLLTFSQWISSTVCHFSITLGAIKPSYSFITWIPADMEFVSTEGIPLKVFTGFPVNPQP